MNITARTSTHPSSESLRHDQRASSRSAPQPEPLSDLIGEELLLLAIAGRPGDRRRIHLELDLRALLARDARRSCNATNRPRLRLAHGRAA